ncbi:flavodoxin FldA [Porphyromonadaceae bacterium]
MKDMGKTAIIYGSSSGITEEVANRIASQMGVEKEDLYNVTNIKADTVAKYDLLLLGSSTDGYGELQEDWYDGVKVLKKSDLTGKKIALFGTGDSSSFSDSFCGALGELYKELESSGAIFIGQVDSAEYTFDDSDALINGQFIGLAIDEMNEPEKTDDRITRWIESIQ